MNGAEERLLAGLNPAQQAVVTFGAGPLLVLAGPGSGKTRVITHRVAYLLAVRGVPARNVLAVTFTNKAAQELRERLHRLVPGEPVWATTFHSLCARLLRQVADRVGRTPSFSILDESDRRRLTVQALKEAKVDTAHFTADMVETRIGRAKADLIGPTEFDERAGSYVERTVAQVYRRYQDLLIEQNAVDFDDLLMLTADLLRRDADLRAAWDRRFEYLLVDEYQDTNLAQYAIARALSVDCPNLCFTGDPDQSIYSWRGADLNNILSFENDFPGAAVLRLEQNYRSTQSILAVADGLIQHNLQRREKALRTDNPAGEQPRVLAHKDDFAEARWAARTILQQLDEQGRGYRDFAILVRTAAMFRPIEAALAERGISYQVIGGRSLFEAKEIRDLLAYVRLVLNPKDDTAFTRVVNVPARGIGATSVGKLADFAAGRGLSLAEALRATGGSIPGLRGKPALALRDFALLLEGLTAVATLPPRQALERLLDETDFMQSLANLPEDERDERVGHLQDLLAQADQFAADQPNADLLAFAEAVSLISASDSRDDSGNQVTVMTLHAAKGLEFPVVMLLGMEDGLLPHRRAVDEGQEEEERRLAFVGITRAMERLYLSYARKRTMQGKTTIGSPSAFLLEIPAESLTREDRVAAGGDWPDADETNPPDSSYDDFSQESAWEEPSRDLYDDLAGDDEAAGTRSRGGRRQPPRSRAGIPVVNAERDADPSDQFRPGMMVVHAEHGVGQILAIEGTGNYRKATIRFPQAGVRNLMLRYSSLEPLA